MQDVTLTIGIPICYTDIKENKTAAEYRGGNPYAPAQVVLAPTQRHSSHRTHSISIFKEDCKKNYELGVAVISHTYAPCRVLNLHGALFSSQMERSHENGIRAVISKQPFGMFADLPSYS